MHFNAITKVVFHLYTLVTLVASATHRTSIDKYQVQVPTFEGEINGHAFKLNGTAQEVWAKLGEIHSHIELMEHGSHDLETGALEKRNKILPPLCIPVRGQTWTTANLETIREGISYLNNLNGRIGLKGHTCSRISCSDMAAIYFCNDNDGWINPATRYLASYAQDLIEFCGGDRVGGQLFDSDWYNIIVRWDWC